MNGKASGIRLLDETPFREIGEDSQYDIITCVASERYEKLGYDEDVAELLSDAMVPLVSIDVSRVDPGTSEPYPFTEPKIRKYTEAMKRGDEFPPIVVVGLELCEGNHRYWAARRAKRRAILAWNVAPFTDVSGELEREDTELMNVSTEKDAETALKTLEAHWDARGVEIDAIVHPGGQELHLSRLEVPKKRRRKGLGTQVMRDLTALADAFSLTVTLTPSTDFGATSVERLKRFYRRFGFVSNKGRHKDYRIRDAMYRLPRVDA